ncbi:MAG: universal stress protein [Candidatus Eisenbacteria bacterium]|nr:universal stress protein [Candidatus Eisenbacteria bacterium]
MKRVLLILSSSRVASACVDGAIRRAVEDRAELVVFYVLDSLMPMGVRQQVSDEGFLGEAPSGRILRALMRERKRQGLGELERISREARARGVACRTELAEGDFLSRSLEAARTEAPSIIFVARRDRSTLSRLVSGSRVEDLKEAAPCEVLIHECTSDA